MITDSILNSFMALPTLLLAALPEFSVSIPEGVLEWVYDIANAVAYLLPLPQLLPILVISLTLKGAQIVWAILLRVKSFIPTMGA